MSRIHAIVLIIQIIVTVLAASHPNSHRQKRLVDGTPTTIRHYPHQASLRLAANSKHYCGASIITEKWLLSAAQCTQGSKAVAKNIFVIVAASNLTNDGKRYDLEKIISHEQFDSAGRVNDISMLKILETFKFEYEGAVLAIALPSFETNIKIEGGFGMEYGTVAGWGVYSLVC